MSYIKFIDSVVGNIARKIEDEFNENDHPRDKGGKFTSKGGEGKGGSKKELVPETETEKAAKEELGEREQKLAAMKKEDEEFNKMSNELVEIASDLDTANDALRALGWDDDYDDLEKAHEALKEAIRRDPETAKELLENTPGRGEEDEQESPKELIQKDLRRNVSTHVEDLIDYAKEDGYEAELESEEYMIVRKDGKEYRAHIDRAGDSYYVDRVEEL